jgi:hypothetical protein
MLLCRIAVPFYLPRFEVALGRGVRMSSSLNQSSLKFANAFPHPVYVGLHENVLTGLRLQRPQRTTVREVSHVARRHLKFTGYFRTSKNLAQFRHLHGSTSLINIGSRNAHA